MTAPAQPPSPALDNDLAFLSASERYLFDVLFRSLGHWQQLATVRNQFTAHGYAYGSFTPVLCRLRKYLDDSKWLIEKKSKDTLRLRQL